jgi:putative spermidine/putrescine transport system permease protein
LAQGALNTTLSKFGVINQPLQIILTENAVIIGIIAVNLPHMVLTLQSVIEGIERTVEVAVFSSAQDRSSCSIVSSGRSFYRILWPLALPGVIAGAILTFILGMNAYATPVLLGGPQFKMMGPLVYGQFRLNNWPFGAAISFILMSATPVSTAIANMLVQRRYRK